MHEHGVVVPVGVDLGRRVDDLLGDRRPQPILWSSLVTTGIPSVNVVSMSFQRARAGIGCAAWTFWTGARVAAG